MNDNPSTRHFHFTLGPVQGFVAQARRTRDFWAGSFILSWLSAVAMRAVEKQGGKIKFPKPDEKFMAALETGRTDLKQGNVPNRFKAEVANGFDPGKVEETVRAAWKALAEEVWKADLEGRANGATRAIWDRQIKAFWDIQWALTDDPNDSNIIDRLKNWRTHLPHDEPGVKCMMMDGWQELSGAPSPHAEVLKKFWGKVRDNGNKGMKTDLREAEHLCAIAFVKRRFARYFKDFDADMPDGWTLKGWKLPPGVPSVHYMAAAPWLTQLIVKANRDNNLSRTMWDFHDAAYDLTGDYGEWETNIRCVRETTEKGAQRKWAALDGTVFFDAMLENKNLWGDEENKAKEVLRKLKKLMDEAKLNPVSPFYAVLRMDG
ncbi:MAG: type III-B CRISPR-associated protein Cas10/Cmr2, partial [Acidobacteria bacterium]|nr:type III-B CRISPR-associated protein Cas10/Cmr2 [Acidobacteriota bacterium]